MGYQLYDHQRDLSRRALESLAKHKSTLMQLCTGGGKTIIFNDIIRRCFNKGYGTLMLAHREELVTQGFEKLYKGYGIKSGIIKSGIPPNYQLPNQIAMVQTLSRRGNSKLIDHLRKRTKVIITDECHHSKASTYKMIYDWFPNAYHLGVTATPVRTNGEGFEDVFKDIQCGPSIKWMEENKFLCPAKCFSNPIASEDLKRIKISKGDYAKQELANLMSDENVTGDVVGTWLQHAKGLQTIVFCVTIDHAQDVVNQYKNRGISAALVTGEAKYKNLRKQIFSDFERKKIKVLVNVGIATEGTDIPGIECVQSIRPTKSLSFYLQIVGRGCRIKDGKDHYVFLDHGNNILEHGVPNADRVWSLKGAGKKSKDEERKFEMITGDGEKTIVTGSNIPRGIKGVTLVEVTEKYNQDLVKKLFDRYLLHANLNDHKPISAFYRLKEYVLRKKKRNLTEDELNHIANKLNYQAGWVYHKLKSR